MGKNQKNEAARLEHITYGIYFIGQLMIFMLVSNFFNLYLTDMGIPALAVGGVLLFTKIWDAINDPLFGVVVDKARLKGGKYKPWVKLSTLLIPLATMFMFSVPSGVSMQIKTVWAVFGYILWDTVYTMCDVPIFALATSMTSSVNERNFLYSLNRFFCILGGLIVVILVPMLYPSLGWTAASLIICVFALVTMLPVGFAAKERTYVKSDKQPTVAELGKYLVKNKYLLIFNGAIILYALTNTVSSVQNYFAINNLGGANWITVLALIMSMPMLIVALTVPKIIKRFDKFRIYLAALASSAVLSVIMYLAGYKNLPLFIVLTVLRSMANSFTGVILVTITADCAEYGHYKSGERAQGVAFSIQTFTAKICTALSGSVGMFILGLAGFKSGEGVVQTPETIDMIWLLFSIFPAIAGSIAFIVLLLFYKLNDHDVQIMAKVNKGEMSRADAETQMRRKY